ncbi:MAG: O-antigen ligase family protein [Acidobacteriota bacterium]
MTETTIGLAGMIILVSGLGIGFYCLKRYEAALLLMMLSPWLATFFVPNSASLEAHESLGSYLRLGLLILLGAVGLIHFVRESARASFKAPLPFVLLGGFLILAVFSTSYSIDPLYTSIRAGSFVVVTCFLFGLFSWLRDVERVNSALNAFYLAVWLVTTLNLISLFLMPGQVWWWNAPHRFQGLAGHPNNLGSFFMISYPVLFWKYSDSDSIGGKAASLLLMGITMGLHLLTGSRASLLASLFGVCLWLAVQRKGGKLVVCALVMATLLLAAIVTLGDSQGMESFSRGRQSSGMFDLTGRPEFWAASLVLINERPFRGYGYAVEGKIWSDRRFLHRELSLWSGSAKTSLHNGYLSTAVGLGWSGLLLWLSIVLAPLLSLWRGRYREYLPMILMVMGMGLAVNFVESAVSGCRSATAITFWIMWTIATRLNCPGFGLGPGRSVRLVHS